MNTLWKKLNIQQNVLPDNLNTDFNEKTINYNI
jgi:hypothetical protein